MLAIKKWDAETGQSEWWITIPGAAIGLNVAQVTFVYAGSFFAAMRFVRESAL